MLSASETELWISEYEAEVALVAATIGSLEAWYEVPEVLLISVTFAGVNAALNLIT